MMDQWFKEIKESDRVALLLLYTGISCAGLAAVVFVLIVCFCHLQEAQVDRILDLLKDFFAIGTGLVGAATIALKLQPKPTESSEKKIEISTTTTPPPPEKQ